jgi:hypothetical protein
MSEARGNCRDDLIHSKDRNALHVPHLNYILLEAIFCSVEGQYSYVRHTATPLSSLCRALVATLLMKLILHSATALGFPVAVVCLPLFTYVSIGPYAKFCHSWLSRNGWTSVYAIPLDPAEGIPLKNRIKKLLMNVLILGCPQRGVERVVHLQTA